MGRRAEDGGRSECPPVAGGIGVESSGEITPRESGPTSLGSLRHERTWQTTSGGKQMTADIRTAGAASHAAEGWHTINWKSAYRIVCRPRPVS